MLTKAIALFVSLWSVAAGAVHQRILVHRVDRKYCKYFTFASVRMRASRSTISFYFSTALIDVQYLLWGNQKIRRQLYYGNTEKENVCGIQQIGFITAFKEEQCVEIDRSTAWLRGVGR